MKKDCKNENQDKSSWCPHCEKFIGIAPKGSPEACDCGHPYLCECTFEMIVPETDENINFEYENFSFLIPIVLFGMFFNCIKILFEKNLILHDYDFNPYEDSPESPLPEESNFLSAMEEFPYMLLKYELISEKEVSDIIEPPESLIKSPQKELGIFFRSVRALYVNGHLDNAELDNVLEMPKIQIKRDPLEEDEF